jgi:glycosyltransferase involved in cell wall biosynthesis
MPTTAPLRFHTIEGQILSTRNVQESGSKQQGLKIAYVCHLYPPYFGGVEKYVHAIATRLGNRHDVSVITTDPTGRLPESDKSEGVRIRRFRSWAFNESIYYSPEMFRYLRKHCDEFDLVHANNYHALPAFYAAESKARNRLVFTPHFHGTQGHYLVRNLLHFPYRLLGWRIFRRSDRVICNTNFEKNRILRNFRLPKHKLIIMRQGVDPAYHIPAGENRDAKTLLCVSRLERYKGIQHVIRALRCLPSFSLTIVGAGPYASTLARLTKELGYEGRVLFKRDVSGKKLRDIYSNSDLSILLSEHESYSQFIAESLSAGIPCVVAKRDALVEWIDGRTCIGVDNPSDVAQVARAVMHLAGHRVTRGLPTWDGYVAELEALYFSLVG